MKTALITGANKSIGFETAKQLGQMGYFVYLGSRDLQKGIEAAGKLHQQGVTSVKAIRIDVTDTQSVAAARNEIENEKGVLDVLINNAGILGGYGQQPTTTAAETIRNVFETNFFGVINVTTAFIELLRKSEAPRIVNVTSGLGSLTLHSDPSWKYYSIKSAGYGPSKTALNAYTVAMAHELKDTAFKINAVDPGYTATDFNNHNGTGSVEGAAAIIVKYATVGADGPTGRYFSNDIEGEESPW